MKTIFKPIPKEKFEEYFIKKIMSQGCYKNSDNTWSCDGNLYLDNMNLPYFPVKFKEIKGSFYCNKNILTSFDNFPDIVDGYFFCYHNEFTSLEYFPRVKGVILNFPNPWKDEETYKEAFIITIKSKGCYENPDRTWSCDNNLYLSFMDLTYLPVKFKEIRGSFNCRCDKLSSFDNFPDIIGENFDCSKNHFTSLTNSPEVKGKINCFPNPWKDEKTYKEAFIKMIKSRGCYKNPDGTWSCGEDLYLNRMDLPYLPVKFKKVKGSFDCSGNHLISFENFPDIIRRDLYIMSNDIPDDYKYPGKVHGEIYR